MQILKIPPSDYRRIQAIAFSPDGLDLAVASGVHLRLFDLRTGQIRREFEFPNNACPLECIYLADGKQMVVSTYGHFGLWDMNANTWSRLNPNKTPIGSRLAMSPNSPWLAIAEMTLSLRWTGGGVRLFHLERGELLSPMDDSQSSTGGIAMSNDGRLLATARMILVRQRGIRYQGTALPDAPINVYDYVVHVRDLSSGTIRQALAGWKQPVTHLAFSPDAQFLAGAGGQRLRVWDLISNREVAAHKPGTKHFQDLVFTNDGRYLATVSNDTTVRIWDTQSWQQRTTYTWKIGRLLNITFAPDGLRAAAGSDKGKIVIWDVEE